MEKKLRNRILAYMLSGIMIVSSASSIVMTVFADETVSDIEEAYQIEESMIEESVIEESVIEESMIEKSATEVEENSDEEERMLEENSREVEDVSEESVSEPNLPGDISATGSLSEESVSPDTSEETLSMVSMSEERISMPDTSEEASLQINLSEELFSTTDISEETESDSGEADTKWDFISEETEEDDESDATTDIDTTVATVSSEVDETADIESVAEPVYDAETVSGESTDEEPVKSGFEDVIENETDYSLEEQDTNTSAEQDMDVAKESDSILPKTSAENSLAEEDAKLTVDENAETVNLRDSRITVMAANLAATNRQQWKVTVTYKTDENPQRQELTEGIHYDVVLVEGNGISGTQKIVVKGTGTVTDLGTFVGTSRPVTYRLLSKDEAKGAYKDITKTFRLALKKDDINNAVYNGTYITPTIEGFNNTVTEGTDYQLVYKNNVNAGKASVTVIGLGEYYGSKTFTFTIKPANIKEVTLDSENLKITPAAKSYRVEAQGSVPDALVYKGKPITFENLSLKLGDRLALRRGTDYTIDYKNNAKAGKATATIKAANNFTGTVRLDYTITRMQVTQTAIEALKEVPAEYAAKGPQVLEIAVNGITLKAGTDFKADYKQIKADIREGRTIPGYVGDITIKGAGAYKDIGSAKLNIKVVPGSFHIKDGVIVEKSAVEKSGTDLKKLIVATKITDAGGTKPAADEIESIVTENTTVRVVPKDKTKFNTAEIPCHVAKKLSSVVKQKKVLKGDTSQERKFDGINKVTLTTSEIVGNYLESKTGDRLTADDIEIVSYKNNHKPGSATVTIQAADSSAYYGTMNVKFKIVTAAKPTLGSGTAEEPDEEETGGTTESGETEESSSVESPSESAGTEESGTEESGTEESGTESSGESTGTEESEIESSSESASSEESSTEQESEPSQPDTELKMNIQIGNHMLTATLVKNSSTEALIEMLSDGPITINMNDYANMEKVGPFPQSLPRNDEPIDTDAGDLILYQGRSFVIYYDTNSWNFTRLGKIDNITKQELKTILGSGSVTVVLSLPEK